jgi:hypothetical protein
LKAYGTSDKIKQLNEGFGDGKCSQEVNDFYLKDQNYFAFLLGVLFHQQTSAEFVWEIP